MYGYVETGKWYNINYIFALRFSGKKVKQIIPWQISKMSDPICGENPKNSLSNSLFSQPLMQLQTLIVND